MSETFVYHKHECKFEQGHILCGDRVVGIPFDVFAQLHRLEIMIQQHDYLSTQAPYSPGPSLKGWRRRYLADEGLPFVEPPETPEIDKRAAKAMKFMAEMDSIEEAKELNEAISRFAPLIKWCQNEAWVEGNTTDAIDLYTIGNPLELDADTVVTVLKAIIQSPIKIQED